MDVWPRIFDVVLASLLGNSSFLRELRPLLEGYPWAVWWHIGVIAFLFSVIDFFIDLNFYLFKFIFILYWFNLWK